MPWDLEVLLVLRYPCSFLVAAEAEKGEKLAAWGRDNLIGSHYLDLRSEARTRFKTCLSLELNLL